MSSQERLLVFDRDFLEDLAFWVSTDRKVALKILELVEAIRRDTFTGGGNPSLCVIWAVVSGLGESLRNIAWFTRWKMVGCYLHKQDTIIKKKPAFRAEERG